MAASGPDRTRARALCAEYASRSDALGWFEALYREAEQGRAVVPWADLVPNPHLVEWHAREGYAFQGKRCLKVGCGRGRYDADPEGLMPWPQTRAEFRIAAELGLREVRFEDFVDQETPPVRRFRIEYVRERA